MLQIDLKDRQNKDVFFLEYYKPLLICLLSFLIFIGSCGTDSGSPRNEVSFAGSWQQAGLENEYINSIKEKGQFIYAATRTDLFQLSLATMAKWNSLGLKEFIEGREVRDFIIFSETEILAGVGTHGGFEEGTIPIWKTTTNGDNWQPYQNGFGNEKGNYNSFAMIDATSTMDTLFSIAGSAIARSINRGESWELVFGLWDKAAFAFFVHIDSQNHKNIWAGGGTLIFEPRLVKSTDGGDNWSRLEPIQNVEADVYDIAINPTISDHVLTGMSGAVEPANIIRKSTDGGDNWQTVFKGIQTFTLNKSLRNEHTVYASGVNPQGTLFFAASSDFGDTWQMIQMEDGPIGIQINDMVSVKKNGREILYLGTNRGVYSYTFEE